MPLNLPSLLEVDSPVYTVAISSDNTKFLWAGGSPGEDCSITVCSTATQEKLFVLQGHKASVMRAHFLPDGSIISASFDSMICGWSAAGALVAVKKPHIDHRADGFAFSNKGRYVLIGDYQGEITGWDMKTQARLFALIGDPNEHQLWALALDPHNKFLVSGGAGGVIRVWDLANQKQVYEIKLGWGNHIHGLAWHPAGKSYAAAVCPDGAAPEDSQPRIVLFEAATGKEIRNLSSVSHPPYSCTFSPDGNLLAAGGGHDDPQSVVGGDKCNIHVWQVETGQMKATFEGHKGLVRDLAFSPDSSQLLSAGWDSTVRSWKL